jgi:hypothetical protein
MGLREGVGSAVSERTIRRHRVSPCVQQSPQVPSDDKGVPIQVRGAMAFNEGLNRTNLETKYQHIQEGEKVKFAYLRQPNIFRSHVLSAPGGCPAEWNIERVIDYDTQWDKAFVEPLETILSVAGWSTQHQASLFD